MTGTSFTVTRHNGRADKKGQAYSVKHNDRSFNLENADHIDESRTAQNIYWDCMQGLHDPRSDQTYETFEDVEKEFYRLFYQESVDAQNKRNEERRHPERNKTTDWLLTDRRTCPEESILQIGNIDGAVDGGVLAQIANAFFTEMEKRYGKHLHFLDWSLHMDEGTPHIHERHVFDCDDGYGYRKPQQEKALELLGVPLPDPDKPVSKRNNRKVTFDKIARELFLDICENHQVYVQREPTTGNRRYLEKQDYIIAKQKALLEQQTQELAAAKAELEETTLKLEDVDALIDEVSAIAYDKAVNVVADTARKEVLDISVAQMDKHATWLDSPERKADVKTRHYAIQQLGAVKKHIMAAVAKLSVHLMDILQKPDVKQAAMQEIQKQAKPSVMAMLRKKKEEAARQEDVQKKEKDNEKKKPQNMEL